MQHCAYASLCLHASLFYFLDKKLDPSGSCEVPSTAVNSSRSHHASWHHQHPIAHPPAGQILDAHRPLCWDDHSSCVSKPVVWFAQSSGHVCYGRYGPVPSHGQPSSANFSSGGEKPRHVPQQSQDCMRVPPCAPNTTHTCRSSTHERDISASIYNMFLTSRSHHSLGNVLWAYLCKAFERFNMSRVCEIVHE